MVDLGDILGKSVSRVARDLEGRELIIEAGFFSVRT